MAPSRPPFCKNGKKHVGPISFRGLCRQCGILAKAHNGSLSSGNCVTGIKKKKAGTLSSGNTTAGTKKRKAGKKGGKTSSGNTITGSTKKFAGKRSGTRRKSKTALIIKKQWLDKILSGRKVWEIRSRPTAKRGWIHLVQSQTKTLVGRAYLVDCVPLSRQEFTQNQKKHRVWNMRAIKYKHIFAWVLKYAQRYCKGFHYKHPLGAVIWVDLH